MSSYTFKYILIGLISVILCFTIHRIWKEFCPSCLVSKKRCHEKEKQYCSESEGRGVGGLHLMGAFCYLSENQCLISNVLTQPNQYNKFQAS